MEDSSDEVRYEVKEVPVISRSWRVITGLTLLFSSPLFVLALFPTLVLFDFKSFDLETIGLLAPYILTYIGMYGLSEAALVPPSLRNKRKVKIVATCLTIGLIGELMLLPALMALFPALLVFAVVPLVFAICYDIRVIKDQIANKNEYAEKSIPSCEPNKEQE